MKLIKKDVADILKVTFPEYEGRKFRLATYRHYQISDYFAGGTREYTQAVKWDGENWVSASLPEAVHNPHNPAAHATINMPVDVMLVIHSIFCGHDSGIVIVASPDCEYVQKRLAA